MASIYPGRIHSVQGLRVVFTGKAWAPRKELHRTVVAMGGLPRNHVSLESEELEILVRGDSARWLMSDFGIKESDIATRLASGLPSAIVSSDEFERLVSEQQAARTRQVVAGLPIDWMVPTTRGRFRRAAAIAGPLDRYHSRAGRIEQSFLRQLHVKPGQKGLVRCALCNRRFPAELVVAAHIKPRSRCSLIERRDAEHVAFPLCLMGCDPLYERGWVSVDAQGVVSISSWMHSIQALETLARRLEDRSCPSHSPQTSKYFAWHHRHRFVQ